MALNFLGLGVNQGGGTGNIVVPPGITNVILDPLPDFGGPDPKNGVYEFTTNFIERVTNVIASGSTDDAVNFDAIFDLVENEVVTIAGDFNSTGKNVEIYGIIQGISIVPNSLYQRPSGMQIDYIVGVEIFVRVS